MITWDEPKRLENLRKHGIDLADCEVVFDAPMATEEDRREAYGEQRLQSGVDQAVVSPAAISITAMAPWRSRPNCSGLDEAA